MPDSELVDRAQARVGTTLKGKYRIDRVLGVGGMAAVYGATHRNKKKFAIKMLHPELSLNADAKQRFLREGYVANTVEHAGAVAVLDDDLAEDGAAFIVMELLDGAAIDELADKHHGRLSARSVLCIADQLLAVLEAAHAKEIVHRDLKPANLFLLRDGTLKVLDFGIARLREAVASGPSGATQTGALMGTPAFLPPEQAGGRTREIDGQTDVWAVGATMFTLLSGEHIHFGENATQMVIAAATKPARSVSTAVPVPAAVASLVDRALAFEKAARWPSAAEMRAALREVYRTQFGGTPSRDQLVELFGEAQTSAAPARTQPLPTPAQTPSPYAGTMQAAGARDSSHVGSGVGGTTAQPVSSTPMSAPAGLPRGRSPLPFVLGGAALLAVVGIGFGVRSMTRSEQSQASGTAPQTSAQPNTSAAPSLPQQASSSSGIPAAPTVSIAESHAEPQTVTHPVVTTHVASSAAHVVAPRPSASSAAKKNCEYVEYLDEKGISRVKEVCK